MRTPTTRLLISAALVLTTVVVSIGAGTPANAGQVPSSSAAFGLNIPNDDMTAYNTAVNDAGRPPTIYSGFVKLDSTSFTVSKLKSLQARGLTPFVTVEPWSWKNTWGTTDLSQYSLKRVAAGAFDSDLTRIATVLRDYGGPAYVRFAHEMNGWWYPWAVGQNGNTAGSYVDAWRHTVGLFRSVDPGRITFVWSPNAVTGSPKESPLEAAYPGDAWVDMVGMTAYGHSASVDDTYGPTLKRLKALTTRPVIISETGVDGAQKAQWIAGFGPWLAAHPEVKAFVWFNTTPATGASGDYRFNATPQTTVSFRQSLTTAYALAALPMGSLTRGAITP